MSKPIPKKYPGIKIQNIKVDTSDFDYKEFMKLFLHEAKPREVKNVVVDAPKNFEFSVRKMGMIVIREKEHKKINMCDVGSLPVSDTAYFMNNRKIFLKHIKNMVSEYEPDTSISCEDLQKEFSLLPHQKLVRTYLSPETPYRGLLLYHGLGSGKTCSSIAIAEGLKPYKNIVVMTPKSLEMNFLQQLTKCGDPLYSIHQSWSWIQNPSDEQLNERCLTRADLLSRRSMKGLWIKGDDSYESLTPEDQESIKKQIDRMIHKKYKFIIYNGITENNIKKHTNNGKLNPFSNNVVIVDEAHNFVSRIINQLTLKKKDMELDDPAIHPSLQLYRLIMEAENCRVVMLSGTPMINYPHEISVLFNMIRGYIYTWSCKTAVSAEKIKEQFPDVDVVHRTQETIMVTQNPTGFTRSSTSDVNQTNYDSSTFDERITKYFNEIGSHFKKEKFTALPDNKDEFYNMFISKKTLQNSTLLKSRIAGLSSYFPDLVQLMPVLMQPHIHLVPMSITQFNEYKITRDDERKSERRYKKKDDSPSGSYRIQTRLLCNTTYPVSARKKRPTNYKAEVLDEEKDEEEEEEVRGIDEFFAEIDSNNEYVKNIETYSPKYAEIINVIQSKAGLQLLYSQFLNIEGIKLFSRVLESRGYTEFKLEKKNDKWDLDSTDIGKPMYIIYGGTKTSVEKKELFRNIFNKNWEAVPDVLREKVKNINIPLFMITSAGAEGISLKHVQYVHLMEPYWNPVRIDQVIGRARRICSHNTLPEKERFVEVHLYLSVFPKDGVISEGLKTDYLNGKEGRIGSTDEYLYEKSNEKRSLSLEVTECIRSSSIDCTLYGSGCLNIPTEDDESLLYLPDIGKDTTKDSDVKLNIMKNDTSYLTSSGEKMVEFKKSNAINGFIPIYPYNKTNQIGFISTTLDKVYDMNKKQVSSYKKLL